MLWRLQAGFQLKERPWLASYLVIYVNVLGYVLLSRTPTLSSSIRPLFFSKAKRSSLNVCQLELEAAGSRHLKRFSNEIRRRSRGTYFSNVPGVTNYLSYHFCLPRCGAMESEELLRNTEKKNSCKCKLTSSSFRTLKVIHTRQ